MSSFMREVPLLLWPFARTSATKLGIRSPMFAGNTAKEILDTAARALSDQRDGLIVMHWPDADAAGHEHGWMSPQYGRACRDLDDALGTLVGGERVLSDPDTMLIALADHGGGGLVFDDHDGDHPLNLTIPLLMVGGRVPWCTLYGDVSILDVAPTITWALGVDAPGGWPGRALCVIPEREDVECAPASMAIDRRVRQA